MAAITLIQAGGRRLRASNATGAQILLTLLIMYGVLFVNHFATGDNVIRIIQSEAFVGLVAVGMTFVVISGGFVDLSVPATIGISANAMLDLLPRSIPLALVVGLGAPLLVGLVNGLMIGRLRLNPVVCTLGVGAAAQGLLLLTTGGRSITGTVKGFQTFGNLKPLGIPIATLAFLITLIVGHVVLTRSRFGFYVKLVGANRGAAAVAGARPPQVLTACFVISAVLAGLAGLFLAAFSNVAVNTIGTNYDFNSLTAIVIGGNSLRGAHGSMGRTLIGALVIGVVSNIMLLLGLSTQVQYCIRGGLFILAVAADAATTRRKEGR